MPEENTAQPTSIDNIQPKMCLEGTVSRTELYGAFVNLGLEHDGLIHISRMAKRRVKKVTDKVNIGDKVKVWVLDVDPEQGRIGLTMVQPPDVEWDELADGQIRKGRVVRMERYGVFVDIGAERPGLLHVREMGAYVRHPNEVVREGEEIEVRITGLNRRKRQIDLSMDLGQEIEDLEENEEPMLSPMELAFHRAELEASKKRDQARKHRQQPGSKKEEDLDAIYRRTLRQSSK